MNCIWIDVRLSWIVGVLATVTLMLTVMLFVVITCRFYQCNRSNKATVQLNKPLPENNKRYSDDPTKGINFSFNESPELLVDFSIPSQDSHHYERVGRYVSQRPSFYQNVDWYECDFVSEMLYVFKKVINSYNVYYFK